MSIATALVHLVQFTARYFMMWASPKKTIEFTDNTLGLKASLRELAALRIKHEQELLRMRVGLQKELDK